MAIYLPPNEAEILQGDIYADLPSIFIDARPLRFGRQYVGAQPKELAGREILTVHTEDGPPPPGGFKWRMVQGGEPALLVRAHKGMAMVISHDCEIENDRNARTLAMIRPIQDLDLDTQGRLFSDDPELEPVYAAFPLIEQQEEPKIDRSFVDFRRLTTVRPAVLDASTRVASLSDDLRKAVAQKFWMYLFRRFELDEANQ